MQNNEKKKLIERISVMSGVSTLNKPPLFILFMTKTATASLHEIIFTEASSPGMKIASNLNGLPAHESDLKPSLLLEQE